MTPVKDKKTGKWLIQFYYKNAFGENKKLPNAVSLVKKKLKNGI